jgi:hypothetical protein
LSINQSLKVGYDITALTNLTWLGDNQISEFMMKWDEIVDNMNSPIEDHHKYSLMLDKIRMGNSKEMDQDLRHIDTHQTDDPKCTTYAFLREALNRALERQRQRRNTNEQRDAALRNLQSQNRNALRGELEEDKRKPPKKDNNKGRDKPDKKGGKIPIPPAVPPPREGRSPRIAMCRALLTRRSVATISTMATSATRVRTNAHFSTCRREKTR